MTRSLCLPLLADNPWEPEDDLIQQIALEDRGIDAIPADGSDERIKHDNTVVQYSRGMAYLREILNHTFLRTVYHTSSRQAKLEYQEVQRNFINDHSNDDPNDPVVKFTALDIIRYIESDCICSNDKALQSIHNSISKMVRHSYQSLLDWLQSFVPPLNKFLKATHQQVLDPDDAKTIWKDHFVTQINLSERTMIMLFQQQHLTANEIRQIKLLPEGEFNEKTLQKLVTKLGSSFEPYKPDKAVMQYVNQHTRQLGLDPLSFTNPKDKNNSSNKSERRKSSSSEKRKHRTDRSDRKRKRTDASDFKSKSDHKSKSDYKSKSRDRDKNKKGKVPFGEHCRRPSCKQRGTHTTHKHSECRYKDDDKTSSHKHPNLGKAPYKAKDHKSKSDTTSQASLPAASATNNVRKCYTCGDPNRLANACPQKSKHNKQNAKTKLKANKSQVI
jgi:hypothetical protein